jgi:hypothetical protein
MGDNILDLDSRRVQRTPSARTRARLTALRLAEAEYEARDGVVQAATGTSTSDLLRQQIVELARETAALRFDRLTATDARARERLSSRRIRALKSLADALLQRHQYDAGAPSPVAIRRITDCLRNEVETAITELFPGQAEDVIQRLRGRLDRGLDDVVAKAVQSPG